MDISIIIPVFNQIDFTKACLTSLLPTIPPGTEVIVIDNGSADGSAEYLAKFSWLKVIINSENRGCAAAWNQGVNAVHSEWVAIVNNDVIFPHNWLDGLCHFATERKVDIVSPALREGASNYDIEEYARDYVRRMHSVARLGMAHGVCFIVHRRVFDIVGLFDENFRIGQYEDADFFRRAKLSGFSLGMTGRSFIHHFGSVTQNSVRQKKAAGQYGEENRAYYRKKHGLTFWKRFVERRHTELRTLLWRTSEKALHNHTLVEKLINGRLRYF
jgi:N-acetylglucosaminyl-diphospho-decaprenol L-rhamnosyltransferase